MPTVGTNGKRLGGAAIQRKKRQRQREEIDLQSQRMAKNSQGQVGLDFIDIPTPNLEDHAESILWWNKVLLVCADKVMRDTVMPLEQKIRYLMDGAAKAGMIRDKAGEQEKIKKILNQQNKQDQPGLTRAFIPATPSMNRPSE